jgi:hypothetical protein
VAAAVLGLDSEFVFCIFVDIDGEDDVDLVTLLHLDLPQQTLIRLRLASAQQNQHLFGYNLTIDGFLLFLTVFNCTLESRCTLTFRSKDF